MKGLTTQAEVTSHTCHPDTPVCGFVAQLYVAGVQVCGVPPWGEARAVVRRVRRVRAVFILGLGGLSLVVVWFVGL